MVESARLKLRSGGFGGGTEVGFVSGGFSREFAVGVSVAGIVKTHCAVVVEDLFLLLSCSVLKIVAAMGLTTVMVTDPSQVGFCWGCCLGSETCSLGVVDSVTGRCGM